MNKRLKSREVQNTPTWGNSPSICKVHACVKRHRPLFPFHLGSWPLGLGEASSSRCPQPSVLFSTASTRLLSLGLQRPQTPSPASECLTMWSLCFFPALVQLEHLGRSSRPLKPAFGGRHRPYMGCLPHIHFPF